MEDNYRKKQFKDMLRSTLFTLGRENREQVTENRQLSTVIWKHIN